MDTHQMAWRAAYRFIRSDGKIPWNERMRPYKQAAIAANRCRGGRGENRRLVCTDEMDSYRRRYEDLVYRLLE